MNKLEVGMYVRTHYGIAKITEHEEKNSNYYNCYYLDKNILDDDEYLGNTLHNYKYYLNQIIGEPSFNIIDLIELGDYVNGQKVVAIHEHYVWNEEDIGTALETEHEYTAILNEDIKSIVTKEQFEQMKYEVE